jgi:two-component system phosphate regulon sensor histidine kinase PhoR
MREGVLLLGPEGRIQLMNPALREMLLLDANVRGRSLLEVIRHADLKQLLDHALRSGEPASSEIEVAGLRPRQLLVHASPTAVPERALLAVFVDVTEIKKLESMRRDFVANVSHELRTPIAAVRSAAETLHAGALTDAKASAHFLDIVTRNAERLDRLVSDLLDLARIESRQYDLSPQPVNLDRLVAHVVDLHRDRADKRKIALHSKIPADVGPARADSRALEQVLSNLVDNAIKYAHEGADVTISAGVSADSIRLAVGDTGPGIDPRHLPRLFERFYRVDAGRSREQGGTGLGLSIVKHLTEAMGGTATVESEVGRGTTFTISLPRA